VGFGKLSGANVSFAEIVVRVVTLGIEFGGLFELRFSEVDLAESGEIGGEGLVCAAVEVGFRRTAFSRWGLALASSD